MYQGIDTIYLIHHSHTDIGYTHDQPIVWDLHRRFIDTALDQFLIPVDPTADHAFRWTIETTAMLEHWLASASPDRIDLLRRFIAEGRIEITAMWLNITPLYDMDEIIESLQPVARLREQFNTPVRYAMNSDVNGQNWPLVDALTDAGIDALSMATNIHFGGSPLAWPNAFKWEGPSGRSILAWNGWDYAFARECGIGESIEAFRDIWWPKIDAWLQERDFPLPVLMMQLYDAFGDNGPACDRISSWVEEWNMAGHGPRIRIATPTDWWAAVREHETALPTYRGDWTDFWNFGAGSSAAEVAINRASRARLRAAQAIDAMLPSGPPHPSMHAAPGTTARAWQSIMRFDEHTWGADVSVSRPYDLDTTTQWHHKAIDAYTGRSLTNMIARDAIANLAQTIDRHDDDVLVVANPGSQHRTLAGPLPLVLAEQLRGRANDETSSRHTADRSTQASPAATDVRQILKSPIDIPPFGYALIRRTDMIESTVSRSDHAVVDSPAGTITFDTQRGGMLSWVDGESGADVIASDPAFPFGGWVRERPIPEPGSTNPRYTMWSPVERRLGLARGWRGTWSAERIGPSALTGHEVLTRDDGTLVRQRFSLPSGQQLTQETYLPSYAPWIEHTSDWIQDLETFPEATYIAFPFALEHPVARVDLGGVAMRVEHDQLPRACRDYYSTQNWVDVTDTARGVTIACPDAPLIQFGDFTFGAGLETSERELSLVLGWVTNNYWETNFRANQPGRVCVRYRLAPHGAPFDESAAHAFGEDAVVPLPIHHLHEGRESQATFSRAGSILRLPSAPVVMQRIWRENSEICLRVLNASDTDTSATVGGQLRSIQYVEWQCGHRDGPDQLEVIDGEVTFTLPARRTACLRITLG